MDVAPPLNTLTTPAPDRPTLRRAALGLAYTALLYASFVHDGFRIAGPVRKLTIGFDSYLVLDRIAAGETGAAAVWHPLAPHYLSQFGLQGAALSALAERFGGDRWPFSVAAASAFALILCAGMAATFVAAGRWLGWLAAHVAVALSACTLIWLSFAPSLYWTSFLLLAPFQLAWLFGGMCLGRPWRFAALTGTISLAVLLKCLCGYEYVTAVVLSPVAALTFHAVRLGMSWRQWLASVALASGAGLLGFAAALSLHSAQIAALTGEDGWQVIASRARERTVEIGDPAAENQQHLEAIGPLKSLNPRAAYVVTAFFRYFAMPPVAAPSGLSRRVFIPLYAFVVFSGAMLFAARRRWLDRDGRALAAASAIGLLASVSWQVLALNHMAVHFHLNLVVFQIPYLPLAYLSIGWAIQRLAASVKLERPASLALGSAAVVLLMATGVHTAVADAGDSAAGQRAVERVSTMLAAGEPIEIETTPCRVVQKLVGDCGFELERSRSARRWCAAEELLEVSVRCPEGSAGRAARVVVLGRATPATALATASGQPAQPHGRMTAQIPLALVRADESLRAFVVAGRRELTVREIAIPKAAAAAAESRGK